MVNAQYFPPQLPEIRISEKLIEDARSSGFKDYVLKQLPSEPLKHAASLINLIENISGDGRAKIAKFATNNLSEHIRQLPAHLQAECYLRVIPLMDPTFGTGNTKLMRDHAAEILENSQQLPASCYLFRLAHMYAETREVRETIAWLDKSNATYEEYAEIIELFFADGLFNEGLEIYDACLAKHEPQDDFLGLVCPYLKSRVKEEKSHNEYFTTPERKRILIKLMCFTGQKDNALSFASHLVLKEKTVRYLIDYYQAPGNQKAEQDLQTTCETLLQMEPDQRSVAITQLLNLGIFSAQETIDLCATIAPCSLYIKRLELLKEQFNTCPSKELLLTEIRKLLTILRLEGMERTSDWEWLDTNLPAPGPTLE